MDIAAVLGDYGWAQIPDINTFYKMVTNWHCILTPQKYPWARYVVQSILDEFAAQKPGYRGAIRGLLLFLSANLLRIYSDDEQSARDKNLSAIGPALEYMHTSYDQAFSMEKLAEICHISPTHFRRLFSAQMGTNPLHFLHQLRVIQSCRLLRSTDKTIAEIATQVGYSSLCCYNQHFRRFMGCTPSAWRKSGGENKPSLITYTGWMEAEEPPNTP